MSIGNLKTDGGKGTNWPWQYKMLKGLQGIIDAIAATSGGTTPSTPIIERVSSVTAPPAANVITDSIKSISFHNAHATATAKVLGEDLKPGETINFDAGGNDHKFAASAFNYDPDPTSNAGDLLIIYVK
tara:strand:+ start:2259 stop:2645 length:387 start_codon:yes stop_codon:yes gene_type:complete